MTCRSTPSASILIVGLLAAPLAGCTVKYSTVVKPAPNMSILSPELQDLSDTTIDTYLRADVRPAFPSVVAVARLVPRYPHRRCSSQDSPLLDIIRDDEAAGWRALIDDEPRLVEQVQFISPMLVSSTPTLKSLREAAAVLHAPVLLVYVQDDDARQGYNDAAMAYWTIVGLFVVPGHTVGHYTACQGLLVDTRSGFVLGTAEGHAKREEHVLPGAVDIATDRVARQAHAEAVADLQARCRQVLAELAARAGGES